MLTVNWQAELLFIRSLCSKLSENSYANQALIRLGLTHVFRSWSDLINELFAYKMVENSQNFLFCLQLNCCFLTYKSAKIITRLKIQPPSPNNFVFLKLLQRL